MSSRLPVGPSRYGGGGWIEFARYANRDVAIVVHATNDFTSPVEFKATVCLDQLGCELKGDEVWIKTWSENAGALEALEESGVLKRTGRYKMVGNDGIAYHAKLTPVALAELRRQEGR